MQVDILFAQTTVACNNFGFVSEFVGAVAVTGCRKLTPAHYNIH